MYGDQIEKISKDGKKTILVELTQDSQILENAVIVDHHNDKADRPASILQVCQLLDIEPTRKMQLIAANDSGYILAMQKMGASQEEIDTIRLGNVKELQLNKKKVLKELLQIKKFKMGLLSLKCPTLRRQLLQIDFLILISHKIY